VAARIDHAAAAKKNGSRSAADRSVWPSNLALGTHLMLEPPSFGHRALSRFTQCCVGSSDSAVRAGYHDVSDLRPGSTASPTGRGRDRFPM
jgi:hypothetical protein